MATLKLFSLAITLMFSIGNINCAGTTGYFYENPIRPFNPPSFSTVRSTAPYPSLQFGQKVETQTRLQLPPIPSLPPLTTYIPKSTTKYQSPYGRVQSTTPINFNTRNIQQQVQHHSQQRFQQQQTQFQRTPQTQTQIQQTSYSYPKAQQIPINTATQQRQSPNTQSTPNIQIQTPKPNPSAAISNVNSIPTQTTAPDVYVIGGRPLKQYKVYEQIDNDIDQEVHNFLPADFFLSTYHNMIGDTHPLAENIQVQNRASTFLQRSQAPPNNIALGSGGLGFVKLPNGNVYLGSGSLGYISSLQHSLEVQDLRSRSDSSGPDALHFGHGPLSDSFYYRNQKD